MKAFIATISVIVVLTFNSTLNAQCSMCKAVVESSAETGGISKGGINNGIVYLMGVPYLLIMTAGYFMYRNYKKNKPEEAN